MPKRLLESARLIAFLTLGSRLLGLVRECVFSRVFGTSTLLSAFRIAWMVPNLARRLFGEGALSAATIPILTEHLKTKGDVSARKLVGSLLTVLIVSLVGLVLVGEGVVGVLRLFSDDEALSLVGLLLPYMVMICTVAVASGVLNVKGHFATPAALPMVLNVAVIVGTLYGAYELDLTGLGLAKVICVSALVGGFIQVVATGWALRAVSFFPIFGSAWSDPQVRRVVTLMGPMVLGLSVVQINSLADYLIAYLFIEADGVRVGPAVLGFAQYLYQLPLGVFGIAIATAIFPMLSEQAVEKDHEELGRIVTRGLRLGLFISIPATVGLMFVATPLVAALYEGGEFKSNSTARVAGTLVVYSAGLVAFFVQHIVIRVFYAMHDSRTPARVAVYMVLLNLALNLVLVFILEERGLALSTVVCAFIQVFWLTLLLRRKTAGIDWSSVLGLGCRITIGAGAMLAALFVADIFVLGAMFSDQRPATALCVFVPLGVGVYVVAARILRIDELRQVLR